MSESILNYPLGVFRFQVNFFLSGESSSERKLCGGAFSECTGLEATMEPKVIKEGGRNYGDIQRAGRVNFATVVLKRGITKNRDLWNWFYLVCNGSYAYRLNAEITQMGFDKNKEDVPVMVWKMKKALPTKFKTADYNSTFDQVAIEELHFVHEGLTHKLL
ncbi:MAG: phage tail protein [Hyphomicrobiales bacterium]|nr:phage tail protein [Hyphomicrobiales bacterium]